MKNRGVKRNKSLLSMDNLDIEENDDEENSSLSNNSDHGKNKLDSNKSDSSKMSDDIKNLKNKRKFEELAIDHSSENDKDKHVS